MAVQHTNQVFGGTGTSCVLWRACQCAGWTNTSTRTEWEGTKVFTHVNVEIKAEPDRSDHNIWEKWKLQREQENSWNYIQRRRIRPVKEKEKQWNEKPGESLKNACENCQRMRLLIQNKKKGTKKNAISGTDSLQRISGTKKARIIDPGIKKVWNMMAHSFLCRNFR